MMSYAVTEFADMGQVKIYICLILAFRFVGKNL